MNPLFNEPGTTMQNNLGTINNFSQFNQNSLKDFLDEIIQNGKIEKSTKKRIKIHVNKNDLDLIRINMNKKNWELVNAGKLKAGDLREYNKNMNWNIEKEKILKYFSKISSGFVYMITATSRYMNNAEANKLMGLFTNICSYVACAEIKNSEYHIHFLVSNSIDTLKLESKLKKFKRFEEDCAVNTIYLPVRRAINYVMKCMLSNETFIGYYPKKNWRSKNLQNYLL
jgi:hypothetical protein